MGDYRSYLPVAGCNNDKKKKKQKTVMMLLDELDSNQQRNCIIAAVVARGFSLLMNISLLAIRAIVWTPIMK
jgi:hypothetical protein